MTAEEPAAAEAREAPDTPKETVETTLAAEDGAKEPETAEAEAWAEAEPTTSDAAPESATAEATSAGAEAPAGVEGTEGTAADPTAAAAESNGEAQARSGHRPGALPTWWTDAYPQVSDVTSATAYLDGLGGAMSRREENGRWVLWTGEQVLFEADTPEELDGFVLGFALSQLIAERHGPIAHARRN